jgi:AcrR family transcriptional regulator
MAIRHIAPGEIAAPEIGTGPDDPVLEAVRASVMAVGVRRTTLTEVARRAGVSRMTLYRRAPDVTALMLELMGRELAALLAREEGRVAHLPNGRERLVDLAIGVVVRLPGEPLFRRVTEVDPDVLLPYLVERQGTTQRLLVDHVRRMLDAGVADGSIRASASETTAACLVHLLTPFVVGRAALPPLPLAALEAELRQLLDSWLVP